METSLVAAIAILVILGGAALILVRQRMLPWGLSSLRALDLESGDGGRHREISVIRTPALTAEEPMAVSPPVARAVPISPLRMGRSEPGAAEDQTLEQPTAFNSTSDSSMALIARIDGLEAQLQELSRLVDRQINEFRRIGEEQAALAMAADAQREAASERLRADLMAALAGSTGRRTSLGDRRTDVSAELYARLARLEAALAAVTNPVLLPGEAYAPPGELIPEALVWENWNEVGERAFALADAFSAQRLHLSEQTRVDLGEFVTSLRVLLTRSVYPNLQPEPGREQQLALHEALGAIATELPRIRASIEREFRAERN